VLRGHEKYLRGQKSLSRYFLMYKKVLRGHEKYLRGQKKSLQILFDVRKDVVGV
jgi:hypothetical protein